MARPTTKDVLLVVAFAIVQLGWLIVCAIAFWLMGYDGGGFAGGVISPVTGVLIAALPSILAIAYVLLRRGRRERQRGGEPPDRFG